MIPPKKKIPLYYCKKCNKMRPVVNKIWCSACGYDIVIYTNKREVVKNE